MKTNRHLPRLAAAGIASFALVALCGAARAQHGLSVDPTIGYSGAHTGGNCDFTFKGERGDKTGEWKKSGKNRWVRERVRYFRIKEAKCTSATGADRENCPCSYESLGSIEVVHHQHKSRRLTVAGKVKKIDVDIIGLDKVPGAEKLLAGIQRVNRSIFQILKRTVIVTTVSPWSDGEAHPTTGDYCFCVGAGASTGGGSTTIGGSTTSPPGASTGGGITDPPEFPPRTPGTMGGDDIDAPLGGATTPGGADTSALPGFPGGVRCTAANDTQVGNFVWDLKYEYTWQLSTSPPYTKFVAGCVLDQFQDRLQWIREKKVTGTLTGAASCHEKDPHFPEDCKPGCELESHPTGYEVTYRRTMQWKPVEKTITCTLGANGLASQTVTFSGIVGWEPEFSPWEVAVGAGPSGDGNACNCDDSEGNNGGGTTPPSGETDPNGGTTPGHEGGEGTGGDGDQDGDDGQEG